MFIAAVVTSWYALICSSGLLGANASVTAHFVTRTDVPQSTIGQSGEHQQSGGIVTGSVVVADSGRPLRFARVRLDGTVPRTVTTDDQGHFIFSGLPVGRFTPVAVKTGFITTIGKPFNVDSAGSRMAIVLRVPRGAVIVGHTFDEFGDPAIDVTVTAMRVQLRQGVRQFVRAATGKTNDIGEYRLFGLSAGRYYVVALSHAVMQPQPPDGAGDLKSDRGYAPTFFPGTTDVDGAQTVTGLAGRTVENIDFMLRSSRGAKITGVAIGLDGRPLMNGVVTAISRMTGTASGNTASIGADGTFTMLNVPPGDYAFRTISIRSGASPGAANGQTLFSMATVTTDGSDVQDVVVAPIAQARIDGRIVVDGGGLDKDSPRRPAIRITPQSLDSGLVGLPLRTVNARNDLTFSTEAPPGRTTLKVSTSSAGVWHLKAIRINGVDVTDSGFEIRPEAPTGGVEVEMTDRVQVVSGRVRGEDGSLVAGVAVVLFASDRTRRNSHADRYVSVVTTREDGTFESTSLPPGEYCALAVQQDDGIEPTDPDFLDGATHEVTKFRLKEAETVTLDLRLSR